MDAEKPKSWPGKAKQFIKECRRVLHVTKKPSGEEFRTIVKVSGMGMAIIGLVGFLIHTAKQIIFP